MKKQKNSPSRSWVRTMKSKTLQVKIVRRARSNHQITFGSSDADEPEQSLNLSNHFLIACRACWILFFWRHGHLYLRTQCAWCDGYGDQSTTDMTIADLFDRIDLQLEIIPTIPSFGTPRHVRWSSSKVIGFVHAHDDTIQLIIACRGRSPTDDVTS